ncbi:MAG: hypothetical protein LBL39_07625 [Planctomycetaceae bacterium]|nr:hypothetical protein [Planctomycetaceae bacterium]
MDNPVQTECSTGSSRPLQPNYVVVQLKTFILTVNVLNCYAVRLERAVCPRAAFHLHGVIHVKVLRT